MPQEVGSVGEIVGNTKKRRPETVPNPGRRRLLKTAAEAAVVLTAGVGLGALLGRNIFNGEEATPSDPNVFDPDAKKGILTPTNTVSKPAQEVFDLVAQQTQADHKLRFIPPAGGAVEYTNETGGNGIQYIEWDGIEVGTVIRSPYPGQLRVDISKRMSPEGVRFHDEKFDHIVLDLQLPADSGAKIIFGNEPVLRLLVPPNTKYFGDFTFPDQKGSTLSTNVVDIDAGDPLFVVGTDKLLFVDGPGSDHERQFRTYYTSMPFEGDKALVFTPPQQ